MIFRGCPLVQHRLPVPPPCYALCPAIRAARFAIDPPTSGRQRRSAEIRETHMPSSYLSPGVYMEEVSSGSKPIEAVGTAVAAFVGFAEQGPLNEPVLVTNWTQFKTTFGDFVGGYYLAHAVYGYFLNGGGTAYVVRVGGSSASANGRSAPMAELPAAGEDEKPALTIAAKDPGQGDLTVEVQGASEGGDDTFKLLVKRGGEVVETFDNVTTRRGPQNVATVVRQQSQLITIEDTKGRQLAVPRQGELALQAPPPAPEKG